MFASALSIIIYIVIIHNNLLSVKGTIRLDRLATKRKSTQKNYLGAMPPYFERSHSNFVGIDGEPPRRHDPELFCLSPT